MNVKIAKQHKTRGIRIRKFLAVIHVDAIVGTVADFQVLEHHVTGPGEMETLAATLDDRACLARPSHDPNGLGRRALKSDQERASIIRSGVDVNGATRRNALG